ncbi:MAG: NADH-quinone oxidoreductase subunit H, partial [Planctomycetaceae bacterium]|nr:NADH-quinone oxidoreductase subunit H [Planctomycetaceae bacterium]
EYSGMRWSFFFMAEYAAMFLVSAVAAILFLGGWNIGIPILEKITWLQNASSWEGLGGFNPGTYITHLIGMVVIVTKASLLVIVQIWVRWTFPRLRIDQVMTTCLKYLLPISCVLFLGATLWPLILLMSIGRTSVIFAPLGDSSPRATQTSVESEEAAQHSVIEPSVVATADSASSKERVKK